MPLIFIACLIAASYIPTRVSYAYCPPYFAFINEKESNHPSCLKISGGMFCGGDLEVMNACLQDVTLSGMLIKAGVTEYGFKKVAWDYNSPEMRKQPWLIKGTYKEGNFIVSGYTENWENKSGVERLFSQIPTYIVKMLAKSFILILLIAIILINKRAKNQKSS